MLFIFNLYSSIAFYGYDLLVETYNSTHKIKQKIALKLAYELTNFWSKTFQVN